MLAFQNLKVRLLYGSTSQWSWVGFRLYERFFSFWMDFKLHWENHLQLQIATM